MDGPMAWQTSRRPLIAFAALAAGLVGSVIALSAAGPLPAVRATTASASASAGSSRPASPATATAAYAAAASTVTDTPRARTALAAPTPLTSPASPAARAAPPRLDLTRTPPSLATDDALRSITGRSMFADPWVEAGATTTLRDGLGPLFHARSCIGCHAGGGRSSPPPLTAGEWQTASGLVAKLGSTGQPDPRYGEQLQPRSVYGPRRPADGRVGDVAQAGHPVGEGELQVSYRPLDGRHADGNAHRLWQPAYRAIGLVEPLARRSTLSARIAPSLETAALIEQVDEATILQRADPQDRDRDGISGHANRVPGAGPASPPTAIGRYGHKAAQAGLRQQTAAALHHDIGITSSLYPAEDCAPRQAACRNARSGAGPSSAFEIDDALLDELVFFLRHLAVPAAARAANADRIDEGRQAFTAARCAACHATDPAYKGLYSDLLLHDLGPGLADGRREHLAGEREWRTAPLAGLRMRKRLAQVESYLHDGRARSLEEAVLWHDGEARTARRAYTRMSAAQRQALLAFLETL